MKTERIGYLLVLLRAIFVRSSAALSAQHPRDGAAESTVEAKAEATMDGTPEVIFNDARINNAILLGEFGIFCEDVNGDPAGSFDNGGRIAVYGSNGEQYIFAEEDALRQYSDMDMMMEDFKAQAARFGTEIVFEQVNKVDFSKRPFTLTTDFNEFKANAIIVCTGASAKLLGLERESTLMGHGVSACATCDGAFYKQKPVMGVGGGDTAIEEAYVLTRHA